MTRLPDWRGRLDAVLHKLARTPFRWGENDCVSFSGRCHEAVTGINPVAEFLGRYDSKLGAAKAIVGYCNGDLEAAAVQMIGPYSTDAIPGDGDIVLINGFYGPTIGVCIDGKAVSVTEAGLMSVPLSYVKGVWCLN